MAVGENKAVRSKNKTGPVAGISWTWPRLVNCCCTSILTTAGLTFSTALMMAWE